MLTIGKNLHRGSGFVLGLLVFVYSSNSGQSLIGCQYLETGKFFRTIEIF